MAKRRELTRRVREAFDLLRGKFREHELLTHASAIAFQVLKSLIPLTLLALALLSAAGRRDIWSKHIAPALKTRFDQPVYHAINFAVEKIFASNSAGLVAFSALLTVWYVASGVRGIMGAINRIYDSEEQRPPWLRWLMSIGLAVCVVASIVGAALLVLAVPKPNGAWEIPVAVARWLGAVAALTITAGILVRLAPSERRPKRWASAGAVFVVAMWLATSVGFRWYVGSIANFKTATGQLTVFIVLMLYAYASAVVLLVGVEVDELLREDADADERGILHILFGIGR